MSLGSLVVDLEANTAKLSSDLGKANEMFESAMHSIGKVCGAAQEALEGLVAAFSIDRVAEFAAGLVEAAASLDELHAMSGLSVTALSALQNEAGKVGVSVDDATRSFDKMQKLAASAVGGNKKAISDFASIGISTKQLAEGLNDPDKLLLLVAQHLSAFADDGNKAALMMTILGKSGNSANEWMKLMAADGLTAASVTEEQAEKAHAFELALNTMIVQVKAAATSFIVDWLPAFESVKSGLITGAEIGGTAFAFMYLIPKLVGGAVMAFGLFSKALKAANVDLVITGSLMQVVGLAYKALAVGILAYEIGTWLYDQSALVRFAGALMVGTLVAMWIEIKYDWQIALSWLTDQLKSWAARIGSVVSIIPGAAADAAKLMAFGASAGVNTAALEAARRAELAANMAAQGSYADYVTHAPAAITAETPEAKAHIIPAPADVKTPNAVSLLAKTMDAQLKTINDAMKAEDAAYQLGNKQIDQDYKEGNVALADYATDKYALLAENYKDTQALYAAEISLVQGYIEQMTQKAAAEKDVNKKAADAAAIVSATQKAQALADAAAASSTKYSEAQLAINAQVTAGQEKFAKTLIDTSMAYATMMGDTEKAAQLQIAQADALKKTELQANGATEALAQLAAVESNTLLNASQKGIDGVSRAVTAYQRGLQNVAAQTQQMTTNMLKSMEDALVSFVQTGKLNWKSLIDSMISDMIRLMVQQQVMPGLSSWLGMAVGAFSGDSTAVTFDSSNIGNIAGPADGFMASPVVAGGLASGGAVSVGNAYTVGEQGPETFVPGMAGNIVPNSGGASGAIVYSPTIQIDSRSDRAAVMSDTAKAVRQGQADMMAMLRRYNPEIKM